MQGELIKIGHHSENRLRKLFEKAHNDMGNFFKLFLKFLHLFDLPNVVFLDVYHLTIQ
jgi:hypothetical protein